jgi:hypothetical protein
LIAELEILALLDGMVALALSSFLSFSSALPHSSSRPLNWSRAFIIAFVMSKSFTTLALASLLGQSAFANPYLQVGRHSQEYAPDHRGAVASESSICSDIGIEMLREGGNAADAV